MPQHIIVEDYEHYAKRKKKKLYRNLKIWFPIIILLVLILTISIVTDTNRINQDKQENEFILYPELYQTCMSSCKNVFSEGEEMIKSCDILKSEQTKIVIDCGYKGVIKICSCLKENMSDMECQDISYNYLKEINCVE